MVKPQNSFAQTLQNASGVTLPAYPSHVASAARSALHSPAVWKLVSCCSLICALGMRRGAASQTSCWCTASDAYLSVGVSLHQSFVHMSALYCGSVP